jgi:outer membrane receptor for ferrienterochelin and colicins
MRRFLVVRAALGPLMWMAASANWAQTPPAPAASAASASAPNPTQTIKITGGRETDTEQRRQSTAAKIVIGRDEIDKFGDATVGEVLRRLPGVTTPGAPGRGGPPRMRGLGSGYTQLLIDGQRMPPGFSLESLTPEQIERIEILRAPTAETGARAIAGTINIVMREGFRRRLNDVRFGFGYENGRFTPGANWTHNNSAGPLTYNLSGSVFNNKREARSFGQTTVTALDTGAVLEERNSAALARDQRQGLNLTSRLQWRLNDSGDVLMLTPSLFHSEAHSDSRFAQQFGVTRPSTVGLYDLGDAVTNSRISNARLNAQWRQRLGDWRAEFNGGGGQLHVRSGTLRREFAASDPQPLRTLLDNNQIREKAGNLNLKLARSWGGDAAVPGSEHSLVSGAEIESLRRNESRTTLDNGAPQFTDFGGNLQATSARIAAYAQDEWGLNPNWAVHGGLRWEGITTRGDASAEPPPRNRSSVWSPLLHAVWKPDAKSRDQLRVSFTRSYRSPPLAQLIARPALNSRFPASGPNEATAPDNAGNPGLLPELATGVDLALERYLQAGGVLSANLFHRNISNLIRGVTTLESVSWSPVPRYVRRQQNIGGAVTQGIELEAKFRLDQLVAETPPVELRSNLSLFNSRVKNVPGPNNRLDQQAKATANLGADYRSRGLPLTLGGNVNWVPGYDTRTALEQTTSVSTKQVWDAYALWTFNPTVAVRLLASNLDPRDYETRTAITTGNELETARSFGPSAVNWQLRLELKL